MFLINRRLNKCVIKLYQEMVEQFVSDCYKNQQMYDKAVDTHPSTIQYVPECSKNEEMCNIAVNRCFFVFDSNPN